MHNSFEMFPGIPWEPDLVEFLNTVLSLKLSP